MRTAPRNTSLPRRRAGGFSLIELLIAVALVGLGLAIIVPNLGALVPSSRVDGAARDLQARLQTLRSDARIQAKPLAMELDLDKARFRTLLPPEERLTTDAPEFRDEDLTDDQKDWIDLETDVEFLGAGDAKNGLAEKGLYRVAFDEYGFTADQVVVLQLKSDNTMVWTLSIRGLTGKVEIERSEDGEVFVPERVEEGAF